MFECNETLSICVVSLTAALAALVAAITAHMKIENKKGKKKP